MSPRIKLVCGLIALFAAGWIAGATIGYRVAKAKAPAPTPQAERAERSQSDRSGRGEFSDRMCSRLKKDLNLTDQQAAQIKPILEETGAELKALHSDNYARVQGILKASREKMKPYLDAEQIKKLEEKDRERELKVNKLSSKPKC